MACIFWIPGFCLQGGGGGANETVGYPIDVAREVYNILAYLPFQRCRHLLHYHIWLPPCPNYDKAWSPQQVATHKGEKDRYVAIQGSVNTMS